MLEELSHADIREFEMWRDRRLARAPKTSTLNNFASAWSRVIGTAVERGFISERVPVPRLSSRGEKSKTRPAFSEQEIEQLLAFMPAWSQQGRLTVEREIRPLLRDYVEMLLYTGTTRSDPLLAPQGNAGVVSCEQLSKDAAQTTLMLMEVQRWYREQSAIKP